MRIVLGSAGDEVEMVLCCPAPEYITFDLAEARAFHAMFGRVLAEAEQSRAPRNLAELLSRPRPPLWTTRG